MGDTTKIEWADKTFNPWIGCQKVSPGCDNCYAEALTERYGWTTWGPHGERKRTSEANWKKPLAWNRAAAKAGVRYRVFSASLADWLDNRAPQSWREDLANLIEATPNLDWLLLTKRIENFDKLAMWHHDDVPPNVWVGSTCEDQANFDRRWRILKDIQAIRFISYEPAIGPLVLGGARPDWIICGGESGRGARMMQPGWAYALKRECESAGIPFFMKQMTGKKPIPDDLMVRQLPSPRARKEPRS